MATPKATATPASVDITLGNVVIPTAALIALPVDSYVRNGVALINERVKVVIAHGDTPVTYTLSLYIQRDPVGDAEALAVAKVKAERDGTKATKEAETDAKRQRETRAAFDLGQQSTMTALKNIGDLAAGVNALQRLGTK